MIKDTQGAVIEAIIIRKDGSTQKLGVIVGGTSWQKITSYFLIKLSNIVTFIKRYGKCAN